MSEEGYSHILKINWACQKINELSHATKTWLEDSSNYSYHLVEDQDNSGGYFLNVEAREIPIAPLSLVIGDIVQNIRSSLDHAVFELGIKHNHLDFHNKNHRSQFPIYGNKNNAGTKVDGYENFVSNGINNAIKYISPEAQSFIESVQPFKDGDKFCDHPLWLLNALSNIDKHRMLHTGVAYGGSYSIKRCTVSGDFSEAPSFIAPGKTVARLGSIVPLDSSESLESLVSPNMIVSFRDEPAEMKPIIETLSSIHEYCATNVLEPIGKYLQ